MTTADEETKEMPVVLLDDAGPVADLEARLAAVERLLSASNTAHIKYAERTKAIIAGLEGELDKCRLLPEDATPAQIASAFGGSVARMSGKIFTLQRAVKELKAELKAKK